MNTKLNNSELSRQAGKHRNYLNAMKHTAPKKYELVKKIGIRQYEEECHKMRVELGDIYYHLMENNNTKQLWEDKFQEWMKKNNFYMFITKAAFSLTEQSMDIRQYEKIKYLIKTFKEWRKDND